VRVLPVARMVRKLGELSYPQQESLLEEISGMGHPADVILIDASLDHPLGFSPLGLAAQETVVVVSASGTSITDAYALIKKVSLAYARKDFRILVTRARAADDARAIYNNIDKLTRARGLARLSYAGYVPLDEQLRQAARLRQPVVELFPDAPAARACRAIAGDLLGWPLRDEDSGGLEQFMQQLIHLSQPPNPVAIYA
jgi:flagellar biosynthesis protein FlhG